MKLFRGFGDNVMREIASLTKIMTCYTVLMLIDERQLPLETLITIDPSCENIPGTSANLKAGDKLTIHELLYGLLLPSGNDAAHMLDLHFTTEECSFVQHMNKNAKRLKLANSFFDCSHGLANHLNFSTAQDIAKLSAICLEDPRFVAIVSQKSKRVIRNNYYWENTHKMLGQQGVVPVKTGVTYSAGPCLATALELHPGIKVVVVLLGCKDMDSRWIETYRLAKWAT